MEPRRLLLLWLSGASELFNILPDPTQLPSAERLNGFRGPGGDLVTVVFKSKPTTVEDGSKFAPLSVSCVF